jgi:hypothetical protein
MKNSQSNNWERAKRMAFWDQGKLTYKTWLKEFVQQKPNVLKQSVNFMKASDLIALVGEKQFIKSWPVISQGSGFNENKKKILDAIWSYQIVGDVSFPVHESVTRFHPKKLDTLKRLINSNGNESIYSIAKSLGRNPRRVYDDIHDFADKGLVILREGQSFGRRVLHVKVKGCHIGRTELI